MGITISHKLAAPKIAIKNILDMAERGANYLKEEESQKQNLPIEIRRISDFQLIVDIEGCETLNIHFKSKKEIIKQEGFNYVEAMWENDENFEEGYMIDKYPQNEIYFCADFCKTQFCGNPTGHKWIAEIIRIVAGRCKIAIINDEADFYYTNKTEDIEESTAEINTMINGISKNLEKAGFKKSQIIKGKTI